MQLNIFRTSKFHSVNQYLISISIIILISVGSYFFIDNSGYRVVALILLLSVSLLAMLFDIFPVLVTALISALIWNFFFIPPTMTFHIGTPEDDLMFLMYFVIALINAVLTFKIREAERKARDKEEKEKSIKLYNILFNSLSHELKTPISTIIGAMDILREEDGKLSEENRKELYYEIQMAGFCLNMQVKNLLNMSRLEAGILQPNPDWCDLNELIFLVIQKNSDDAKNHIIQFQPKDNLPLIWIDNGFIEQVLHNILLNALQYTPTGSKINVKAEQTGTSCQIIIADNGNGFPEDEMDFAFDKFYRLKNSTLGGTGLGLSIAKGFTEALGGTIKLENQTSGGARITISIPAETPSFNKFENE